MRKSTKLISGALMALKPVLDDCSLEKTREAQNKLGLIMTRIDINKVAVAPKNFEKFKAAWVTPKKRKSDGVILYLHGGGYVAGDIDYALGFATKLSSSLNINVFCAAYRLAPENKFPCALDDAIEAYKYLLETYPPEKIVLCGESAGGGLCYSLCLKLKELSLNLPSSIVAISPWCDLTHSGKSHIDNADLDPSLSTKRLEYFAKQYTRERKNPLSSPIFGDLSFMPPSLIMVGSCEILLNDSTELHRRLKENKRDAHLIIRDGMWHAYILYSLKESKEDMKIISKFIGEKLNEKKFKMAKT